MTASPHTAALSSLTERVGDAERDALMAELNGHHAHGRLSADELDRRLGLALSAVTRYDLLVLVNDLPRAALPAARPSPVPALREAGAAAAAKAGAAVLTAAPVVAAGWILGAEYSSSVGFYGTLTGGVLGYATHAVRTRLRRR